METPLPWSPADVIESQLVFLMNNRVEEYGLDDLLRSSAEVLGKGTFGYSYKAFLEDRGITVAVKKLKNGCLSEKEFKEKVQELASMVAHENLLPLKAYCCHRSERILVYEYMTRRSLAFALHGNGGVNKTPLTWKVRCSIIHGVARGIRYLHAQGSNVCHGNIRSSNVLLSNTYHARLSDFGIAQFVTPEAKPVLITGYRAPEVKYAREVSPKSDVYSFGVLLLEILTGKPPLCAVTQIEGIDLPQWIRSTLRENPILDVLDTTLVNCKDQNMEEQMMDLLQLAICCTFQNPHKRPSMAAVTIQIQETCKCAVENDTNTSIKRQHQSTLRKRF